MKNSLINQIEALKKEGKKAFAVLLDPDHISEEGLIKVAKSVNDFDVDFILVGGSLVNGNEIHDQIPFLRQYTDKPVILFPGSLNQISPDADGILFLSLNQWTQSGFADRSPCRGRSPALSNGRRGAANRIYAD